MKRIFLVDFDGTITVQDSCQAMVERFCRPGWQELNRLWEEDQLDTIQCARQTFQLMETTLPELERHLMGILIRPFFADFLKAAAQCGHEVYVVSDGYDVNIHCILTRYGLDRLTVFCNQLTCREGKFDLNCPHFNEACGKCGTCKTAVLKQFKQPDNQIVYIGDGWSDHCPVHHADVVFAKDKLRDYCTRHGISCLSYQTFQEVLEWILAVS